MSGSGSGPQRSDRTGILKGIGNSYSSRLFINVLSAVVNAYHHPTSHVYDVPCSLTLSFMLIPHITPRRCARLKQGKNVSPSACHMT